jgi:hypothetical protein
LEALRMSYWVTARVNEASESRSADTVEDAAREARRLEKSGAVNLRIICPDFLSLTLEEIEELERMLPKDDPA